MFRGTRTILIASVALLLPATGAPPAFGAGFAVLEQSAKRNGSALAGAGAAADDVSVVWFNPAAMTELGAGVAIGAHLIDPTFEFDDGASAQVTPIGNLPLLPGGDRRADGGELALVPNVSYLRPIGDRCYVGVMLNAPFGLSTSYDDDWLGRYQAVDSEITVYNLNPAAAFRVNEHWAIGAGISLNYLDARLTNALDFAAICAGLAGGACPNGAVPGQGAFDGFVENEADGLSAGYNLGVLWEPGQGTRVGLSYRSEVDHDLEGDADFTAPAGLGGFAALGPVLGGALAATFADGDIEASVTLPDTASLSFHHPLTPRFALLAAVTWTGWSSLPELRIEFDNPLTPTGVERLGWDDTWRYSLGASYGLGDRWTVRGGLAYDESPVPNAELRTPRLPDNDRTWVALGGTWDPPGAGSLDFAYARIFIPDTDVDSLGSTGNRLRGEYGSDANVVSLEFRYEL